MDPIKLFIKRPIFTAMLMVAVVVFGLFSLPKIGVDQYPNVDIPIVTVTTVLPGADPATIEKDVTEPLEEVLNTVPGLDTLTSINLENVSQIVIRFNLDKSIDVAAQDVRDRVQATLSKLPTDVRAPQVQKLDLGAAPIVTLALSGPLPPERLTAVADDVIKPALQQIAGVGTVDLFGDRKLEVRVTLDPVRLRAFGLTATDAVGALRAQDLDVAGGRTAETSVERIVKLRAEAHSVEDLRNLVLASPTGVPVRLGDVAAVTAGPAEARGLARFGHETAIGLTLRKQSGANTVQVADAVIASLAELETTLPQGCKLEMVNDGSRFIRSSVGAVEEDLVIGGLLAVAVVLVFLRNWRSTLVSAVALPTSVIGTFAIMRALGFTFNIITMLALTLSIGLLIDDAIVVIENIVRHVEEGMPPMQAAEVATKQIAIAVLAVTLAIVAVFLPVAFMDGIMGRFFYQFGVTVVVAVIISYAVSMILTPMLSSRVLREGGVLDRSIWRLVERSLSALERAYRRVLRVLLERRAMTVAVSVALLVGTVFLAKRMEFSFMPVQDMSSAKIAIELPSGTRLQDTERQLADLVKQVERLPGVINTFTTAGGGVQEEVNKGEILINLVPIKARTYSQAQFKDYLRKILKPLAGTTMAVRDGAASMGSGRTQAIQFGVRGANWDEVLAAAQKTRKAMQSNPMFIDVDMTYRAGKPQIDVAVDRDRAASLGIAAAPLGQSLRVLLGRDKVADFRENGVNSEIRVALPDQILADPMALGAVQVRSPSGAMVELRNIATLTSGEGPGQIDRQAQVRQIVLLADLSSGTSLSSAMRFLNEFAKSSLPPTVKSGFDGQSRELGSALKAFGIALGLGVVLLYIILAAQFESLIHPFSIMMSLPFAVIGALGGLVIAGQDMSIFAMIGMIMLMGLVSKNGILLVEFTNQLREQGRSIHDALLEAGPVRLRPILMTTVAMIAGMIPVALARGDGAESRVPMAVAIIGGLVTSTFLTLGVVPVVYSLLDGLSRRVKGKAHETSASTADAVPAEAVPVAE